MNVEEYLKHYGIKGMKWGVRKDRETSGSRKSKDPLNSLKERTIAKAYNIGVKMAPREQTYAVKRLLNNANDNVKTISSITLENARSKGVLPTNKKLLDAIEKDGIEKHKKAKYDLDDKDIGRLKEYTNAARFSRNVNSYLAIGTPKKYAERSEALKDTLRKTKVDNTTVFRSCNINFSFNGISKKLKDMSEEDLAKNFESFSKNFKGKTFKENRIFSTSTSPNFAIDTWRKVNPTAAKTYNTYMILNTKNCPGVLADGRTKTNKKLVNTRSNQEGILAPSRIKYESLAYDKKRGMFVITATAMGDD